MSIAVAILLAVAAAGPAEFKEANEGFLHGQYDRAIEGYRTLLASGVSDPDVHYNLGNAYLASGRRGMAVLHYERALARNPGDDDARANLEFAQKGLQDEAAFMRGLKTPVEDFLRALPLGPVLGCALAAWALTFTLLLVRRFFMPGTARRVFTAVLVPAAVVAAITCSLAAGGAWVREARPRCVVLSDTAELKEGPSESFRSVVTLREGVTAGLRGSEGTWVKIVLPSGVAGWVRADVVGKI
jgi:hypothetical protein